MSVDSGLRAKEISAVTFEMVTDSSGALTDEIRLLDSASKGKSGGVIFISKRLGEALAIFADTQKMIGALIKNERGGSMSAQSVTNWFFSLYQRLGYEGCSSHQTGVRSFILASMLSSPPRMHVQMILLMSPRSLCTALRSLGRT